MGSWVVGHRILAGGDWFRMMWGDLLGRGIFAVDGDEWYAQRKSAAPMFTRTRFRDQIWHVVDSKSMELGDVLRAVPPGGTVDMFNIISRFTLDAIGEIGFSRDLGTLRDAESPFLRAFDRATQLTTSRLVRPFWRIERALGIGYEAELRRHLDTLSEYCTETIRLLQAGNPNTRNGSFVGMYVEDFKRAGRTADDAELKDMVLNFLLAGRDTMAQALCWTLWVLMGHPHVEAKLLQEISEVLGDGPLTLENTNDLRYSQNVINEALRLFPSVAVDLKMANEDDTLPDGTFLPRGTILQYDAYCMGRDPDLWGEDASMFRPERWEGRAWPSSFEYPVFNAGPRECLGKRLAWIEMRSCLVAVLRSVRLELAVPRDQIFRDLQMTIGMSSGLPCRVYPRTSS